MKLFKDILNVAISNIASFGTSFVIGFILPAILSVADYGNYKEYTLFLSFAYLFNLGYNDGIYIKYGGKDKKELDLNIVHQEHLFILFFQLFIFTLMISYSLIIQNVVIGLFSVATLFVALNTYHQNLLQAIGEFDIYSKGNIFKSILYVVILLFGIFVLKSESYVFYIFLNIISFVFLFFYYELKFKENFGISRRWKFNGKLHIFKIGIFILIANMSLTFVGNVGSWIVNREFTIEDFAQYSFQNSILNVILLIVNAVGMVFYNVISRDDDQNILKEIKNLSLLLGVYSGLSYFIFAAIINRFLPDYNSSIELLSMTFIAVPYIMISKILITNLYKSNRSEIKYFKDSSILAIASLIFVWLVYFFSNDMVYIALGTTVTYIVWVHYSLNIEFKFLKYSAKDVGLIASHFFVFYTSSNLLSLLWGTVTYLIYLLILTVINRRYVLQLLNKIF